MGIGRIKKLLIVATILLGVFSFTGCDATMQSADVASRKLSAVSITDKSPANSKATKTFTATVNLYQDYESVVTKHMGNGDHYKTLEENLYSYQYGPYGGPIVSDWPLLNGKNVIMSNETNYTLDPVTGEISGKNRSVINIVDDNGAVVLSLNAKGPLDGTLFGAAIDMKLVSKGSKSSDVKVSGKVNGVFSWMGINYETGEITQILPNGTFTLSGTYK